MFKVKSFFKMLTFSVSFLFFLFSSASMYAQDTDGDGVPDTTDIDDDNDGVLDELEDALTITWITVDETTPLPTDPNNPNQLENDGTGVFEIPINGSGTLPNSGRVTLTSAVDNFPAIDSWRQFDPTGTDPASVDIGSGYETNFTTDPSPKYMDLLDTGSIGNIPRDVTIDFGAAANAIGTSPDEYIYTFGIVGLGSNLTRDTQIESSVQLIVAGFQTDSYNNPANDPNEFSFFGTTASPTMQPNLGDTGTFIRTSSANARFDNYTYYTIDPSVSSFSLDWTSLLPAPGDQHGFVVGVIELQNTDGDAVINSKDSDSDNDGIPDLYEVGNGAAAFDTNGNGFLDVIDGFVDNGILANSTAGNGLDDRIENLVGTADAGITPIDSFTADGIPDYLDLDSDDDGIPDNIEAQTTAGYQPPLGADDDGDGIDNQYDTDFAGSTPITAPTDTDGNTTENLPDYLDLDADDDTYSDTVEAGLTNDGMTTDTDGDGLLDTFDTVDTTGLAFDVNDALNNGASDTNNDDNAATPEVDFRETLDNDGDGIIDSVDLDDDNDGIPDLVETNGNDPTADGDGDGVPAYLDNDDTNPSIGDTDGAVQPAFDIDGDGISNHLDLDADNDGILDIVEGGGIDANGDGEVDYPTVGDPTSIIDADNDGLADVVDNVGGTFTNGTPLTTPNTDNTGNPNYLDIDSDDDGIPDNVEAQTTAGYQPPLGADDDNDGIDNQYDTDFAGSTPITVPTDTDGNTTENLPDYLDLDADDDTVLDTVEAGFTNNGMTTDTDGDGLLDTFDTVDTTGLAFDVNDALNNGASDTDNSNNTTTPEVNFREVLDSDNDGLSDIEEGVQGTDPTNPDSDGDSILDGSEVADGTNPNDPCDSIGGTPPAGSACNVEVRNTIVTPNDDGENDVFIIDQIELFPNNTVRIYNRWGVLVYETKRYDNNSNAFRGISNGRATVSGSDGLPAGIYYYVIEYSDTKGEQQQAGYLYLN